MPLSDIEKAALLLIALGPQRSQRILNQLSTNELLPIITAMKKMRTIDEATRTEALEEIADWLDDQASDKGPTSDQAVNLLNAMGPYLPEHFNPNTIDWNRAGFGFDPPKNDNGPQLPGGRR